MGDNKVLGKGLVELFSENTFTIDDVKEGEIIVQLELSKIKPNPYQPRKVFNQERIDELAQSIIEHGVFQPIIVKAVGEDSYIIVSGERRYRASEKVGLTTIPAIIRNYDNSLVQEIALLENLQREDLSAIEEAEAYKGLIDNLGYTQQDLSERIGKSRSHVTNMLGLLALPQEIQNMISHNEISMGHARVLSKLKDKIRSVELAHRVIRDRLSVRELEDLAKEEPRSNQIRLSRKNPQIVTLERQLKKKYGLVFKIGEDKILIKSDSEDELTKILSKLLEE